MQHGAVHAFLVLVEFCLLRPPAHAAASTQQERGPVCARHSAAGGDARQAAWALAAGHSVGAGGTWYPVSDQSLLQLDQDTCMSQRLAV